MKSKAIIAVIGGDNRELILISQLKDNIAYSLRCFGQAKGALPIDIMSCTNIGEALSGADILLLPMAGVSMQGMVYNAFGQLINLTAADLTLMKSDAAVISGIASNYLSDICKIADKRLITTAESDAVAVPNSIPTAEGAISLAIKNSKETINGSKTLIIGYGRVGQALACRMQALGSNTYVVNRGDALWEKAECSGYSLLSWSSFAEELGEFDYIFNTVPAPVLTYFCLKHVKKEALLMDLASMPGGVDQKAAAKLGINYIQALGLPGKFAPTSAGKILAAVYPLIIGEHLGRREAKDE